MSCCSAAGPTAHVEADALPWNGRHCMKLGRIRLLRVAGHTLFVGPHWYCTFAMLGVINGVGCMFLFGVASFLGSLHLLGGFLATIGSSVACIACSMGDPGIVQHPGGPSGTGGPGKPHQMLPSSGKRECNACNIIQPRGCLHCEYCEVCIVGWDHHCPWMSKCIGGQNLQAFNRFMGVSMISLTYVVIVTVVTA